MAAPSHLYRIIPVSEPPSLSPTTAAPREIDILFFAAAITGDMLLLERITEKYKNGDGFGKVRYTKLMFTDGHNALHVAAIAGTTAVCKFLVENLEFQAGLIGEVDAKLLSNGSLCKTKMNFGKKALADAQACISLKPLWAKAHYREGAAWNVLRKFDKAVELFSKALSLDPGNKEIKKAYMEAQAERNRFKHWDEEHVRTLPELIL